MLLGQKLDLDADNGVAWVRADHYARGAQRHALVEYEAPEDAARAVRELSDANNWYLHWPFLRQYLWVSHARTPNLESVKGALLRKQSVAYMFDPELLSGQCLLLSTY